VSVSLVRVAVLLSSQVREQAIEALKTREQEWSALMDLRVAEVQAVERARKPAEREVIKYVYKDKAVDDSQCAVRVNGLHVIESYAIAAGLVKD